MSELPDWSRGAMAAACLGLVWGALRWLRSRLDSGDITLVSRSGASLTSRVAELERELAACRVAVQRAEDCLRCAVVERDAAQERVIELQREWLHSLRAGGKRNERNED